MAGEVFYRNGIEWPLTLELLAIFLLPTPAVLCGSGDAAAPRAARRIGKQNVRYMTFCIAHVCF